MSQATVRTSEKVTAAGSSYGRRRMVVGRDPRPCPNDTLVKERYILQYRLIYKIQGCATCLHTQKLKQQATNNKLRTTNHELRTERIVSYPAQSNKMLKYKNVKFLQLFAKKCALLHTFVKFLQTSATFCTLFSVFFLTPFTHTTQAANQHSFIDKK
jgi:hypothetical protein